MTRDDVIRMACDAGVWIPMGSEREKCVDTLERFASLIATAERDKLYALPGAQDGIRWDLLPGWLIDHHEGAVLSEELLQRALAEMLAEMPKPEVQTALRERVMDAIAEALGDAYDCTRHWSAWGYGTMSQDDFSLVTDDSDRIGEIADAAIGAIGAQPAPSVPDFANTKDAARYRWLRENGLANEKRESRAVLPRSGKKASMAFRYWTTPEELDMTIDAMIAAVPGAKS